jgi:tRNA-Thr(GGU) m(6)t(6)A37 methyltransferase TsaA
MNDEQIRKFFNSSFIIQRSAFRKCVTDIILKPIGIVHSEVKDPRAMPFMGAPATIEVFSAYADGLRYLEKHSHLWVIAWLSLAARDKLLVAPRGLRDETEAGLHGAFAVRLATRPNPVGLSVAKIEATEGNRVHVDRIDFIDETPVIDMKPYVRRFEAIAVARNEPIRHPVNREAALRGLVIEAENFHGERCGGLALAVRIVEHARSTFFDHRNPLGLEVVAPQHRGCLIDNLIALLGASFGRGTLRLHHDDVVILRHGQKQYAYALRAPLTSGVETIVAAPETELFYFARL